jgi:Animal haem peroxidase
MSAPSRPAGRVVRNVHHGSEVVPDLSPVAGPPAGAQADARSPQAVEVSDAFAGEAVEAQQPPTTPFGYLFDKLAADFPNRHLPNDAATVVPRLKALGRAMIENEAAQGSELQSAGNSTIPPVYTYWGQFIDHDITLNTDNNRNVSDITQTDLAPLTPEFVISHLRNGRQPALNLDSLYGDGPTFAGGPPTVAGNMYEGLKLKLSTIAENEFIPGELIDPVGDKERDLFRETTLLDDPNSPDVDAAVAVVGDSRNDENLIIAQLHVGFAKFHNAVLAAVQAQPDSPTQPQELFERVRQLVTWQYQWLVVHDYLKTVTLPGVVDKVLLGGNKRFAERNGATYMPLEFSVAGFRFGHTMVRAFYDYNRNFGRNTNGGNGNTANFATFEQLFAFTGSARNAQGEAAPFSGTQLTTLPFNWVIEWNRFVDKGATRPDHFARKIDTQLAPPLFDMLNQISKNEASFPIVIRELLSRLAVRNLLRGYSLALPTGQAVAEELEISALTPEQLQSGNTASFNAVLRAGNFHTATPLWYYVLKEAEVTANGNSLGPVGSRIVVETLIGQLRADPGSFLRVTNGWDPQKGVQLDGEPIVTIGDLLRFAGVFPAPDPA